MKTDIELKTTSEFAAEIVGFLNAYIDGGALITNYSVNNEVIEKPSEDNSHIRKSPGRRLTITIQLQRPEETPG